ncbi:MAG TPA: TIM barrel protein [Candidatus Bathyarchaeia archaeon]|nr:TIM barrel protein [Candidatus Bathyarchaeia archaeon]
MADHPRFGPAGMPLGFKLLKQPVTEMPRYLRAENLDSFEYEMVRWGPKPQIKQETAEELGRRAVEHDIWLTAHGSYFINLTSPDKEKLEASKRRLLACVQGASWMGAHVVVFHPGSYAGRPPKHVFEICAKAMKEVVETMRSMGITKVHLAPEMMGKPSQFGSVEEVLALCENVDLTEPNVDWAHLHARERGRFKTIEDLGKVMDEIEKKLGAEALRNLHCHYSHIEFTDKGERRHHNIDEGEYGPDFKFLAKLIVERGLNPVVACETPNLDIDAQKLRDTVLQEMKHKRKSPKE